MATDAGERLYEAARDCKLGECRRLLNAGVAVDSVSGYFADETPLIAAGREGHLDVVALLVEKGAALNARSQFGGTPLYYAAKYHAAGKRHIACVRALLAATLPAGADAEMRSLFV